jgi:hypothetical protein
MLTLVELNELCASIAEETLEASDEEMYLENLRVKLSEAAAMEYAANSYDFDAMAYSSM